MEPRRINNGSVFWGLVSNIISVALIILVFVFQMRLEINIKFTAYSMICVVINLLLFAMFLKSFFIFYDGLMIRIAKSKGNEGSGEIVSSWVEKKYVLSKNYYFYFVRYQYVDSNGLSYEKKEKISFEEYEAIHFSQMIPLLVYNGRAIINRNCFSSNMHVR